eukprot:TRINITY_DN99277_c0_g1_i1.p1 TRINITY_DN99277_c0_g1~~TRINITY_DN99277_c0_g1_i1.p1  ORF type:complete len:128 (+),score=20.53 TRINITY_DN99277_c0_g1_i1:89-472(+)
MAGSSRDKVATPSDLFFIGSSEDRDDVPAAQSGSKEENSNRLLQQLQQLTSLGTSGKLRAGANGDKDASSSKLRSSQKSDKKHSKSITDPARQREIRSLQESMASITQQLEECRDKRKGAKKSLISL